MEGVDVPLRARSANHVDGGTVIRIDRDGQRRTDSFLAEGGGIGPWNRDFLDDQPAGNLSEGSLRA